jgi:cytochrome c
MGSGRMLESLALPSGLLVLVSVLAFASAAQAQENGEALVQRAMCYACHQMESPSLGPPWRAIAARHAARKALMTVVLASKIMRGGGGNWGLVPMVPNQRVTEEEARILAEWVLEQAPDD